jgi:glutamate 5-kinase
MRTKVDAAEIAVQAGTLTAIANGTVPDILQKLLSLSVSATWFLPHGKRMPGRKRWILGRKHVSGSITVDFGARRAVSEKGKSLLPSGVWDVQGEFESGSLVEVCDPKGNVFARGLSSYSSEELRRIKGKPTTEIRRLLRGRSQYAALHRDDLVLV